MPLLQRVAKPSPSGVFLLNNFVLVCLLFSDLLSGNFYFEGYSAVQLLNIRRQFVM
jgi:hypothetical protein